MLSGFIFSFFTDSRQSDDIFLTVIILCGVVSIFGAIAPRLGWVEIVFTDEDRKRLTYKLHQTVALREHGTWGKLFSDKYYRSFEIGPKGTDQPRPPTQGSQSKNPS
jgi:hypothetical protein